MKKLLIGIFTLGFMMWGTSMYCQTNQSSPVKQDTETQASNPGTVTSVDLVKQNQEDEGVNNPPSQTEPAQISEEQYREETGLLDPPSVPITPPTPNEAQIRADEGR